MEIAMKEYLVFRLYGPMASWGQAAVGGDRPTGVQPSRSALLGLLGAALGIKRDEEARLRELQESVLVAVKHCFPTTLMRDYHTTQVPSANQKVVHYTRKSELSEAKLNTILSSRDYRCDGLWVVSITIKDGSEMDLQQLQNALLQPAYPLYLGRKSCPLALPLMPKIVQEKSLKSALDTTFPPLVSEKSDKYWLGSNGQVTYFWEGGREEFANDGVLTTNPWDEPVHRGRWQFKQRVLHQLTLNEG
jgi:CRISPR system Cascade subunit CasD